MPVTLWSHPLASYCHKVLIALDELQVAHQLRQVDGLPRSDPEFAALNPLGKMPVLVDGDRVVAESSIVIEYLDRARPGPLRLIPDDPEAALEVRYWDRVFDAYVQGAMQAVVAERIRPEGNPDPYGVDAARSELRALWTVIDARMAGREWVAGGFSMADCAAAPALFFGSAIEPFGFGQRNLVAYFDRLMQRPSVARTYDAARPFLHWFPFHDGLAPGWVA